GRCQRAACAGAHDHGQRRFDRQTDVRGGRRSGEGFPCGARRTSARDALSKINSLSADHVPHRFYYGWLVVFAAAMAMVGTLPGRSQGLGLITEPLLNDLRLDRVTYATVSFWATIAGATGAIGIGRAIDRFGARVILTLVSLALGLIV